MGDEPNGLYGMVAGSFTLEMAPHERGPHFTHTYRPGTWLGASPCSRAVPGSARSSPPGPAAACISLGVLGVLTLELALSALDDLTIRKPRQRVAAILLRLVGAWSGNNPSNGGPELDLTQGDLAHIANVSRATVSELLDALEAGGVIARVYGRIRFVDMAGLRRLLEVG